MSLRLVAAAWRRLNIGNLQRGFAQIAGAGMIEAAADAGYDTALGLCGNEGQVSVIEMTGHEAFVFAAERISDGGSGLSVLIGWCPYPEAVSVILEEANAYMEEMLLDEMEEEFDA